LPLLNVVAQFSTLNIVKKMEDDGLIMIVIIYVFIHMMAHNFMNTVIASWQGSGAEGQGATRGEGATSLWREGLTTMHNPNLDETFFVLIVEDMGFMLSDEVL
ncbi:hypothetical protein ACJX0J_007842, partial [Zea mays]